MLSPGFPVLPLLTPRLPLLLRVLLAACTGRGEITLSSFRCLCSFHPPVRGGWEGWTYPHTVDLDGWTLCAHLCVASSYVHSCVLRVHAARPSYFYHPNKYILILHDSLPRDPHLCAAGL